MSLKPISNNQLYNELLYNRYMLTTLLVNVYTLMDKLTDTTNILGNYISKKDREKIKNINKEKSLIQYENFSIHNKQYEALVNMFDADVVNKSVMLYDGYIKRTGKRVVNVYKKLKTLCENLKQQQTISDKVNEVIQETLSIPYESIDNKDLAVKYINCKPTYLRNVDKACIYLKEKFNLGDNDVH